MELLWLTEHPQYEQRVVGIREFIDSPDYLNCGGECWESIKSDLEALFGGPYDEAAFCESIGAGKSYKASIIIAYMVYRILCLKNPQKSLGLATGSNICFINMSVRAEQSKKVVFGEIKSRIDYSSWFQKYYPPDPNIRSELRFAKSVIIMPGNSKETFPLGFNILGGVMDEAAFYTETPGRDVAKEIFNALHSRIKNRFGDKGLLVMISSPRYVDDFIERKMAEAVTNPKIFSRRKKLWDSKPLDRFSGKWIDFDGEQIPLEFAIEAKRDPERFRRDILAMPSLALEPYFKQWAFVEAAIDPKLVSPLSEDGKIKAEFKGKPGKGYYIHIDLSLTTDSTGIAMVHEEGGIVYVDLMMKIAPIPGQEIDLGEIKGIVTGLKTLGFDIRKVTYDQFQSASSIQELNKLGFNAEKFSLDRDLAGYSTLKDLMYAGKCKMYRYEPLLDEMRRLELIKGKYVDHPANGSKDVADALAGAVYSCIANRSDFQFWVSGSSRQVKTEEEIQRESSTLTADGLVPYGYYGWNRRY